MKQAQYNRGDVFQNGLYVGTTEAGVEWVARATRTLTLEEAFQRMCERFDQRRKPVRVIRIRKFTSSLAQEVAAFTNLVRQENGLTGMVAMGATYIEADVDFLTYLAQDLRERADEEEDGYAMAQRSTCECSDEFWEAAGKRLATSLRKVAQRIERVL